MVDTAPTGSQTSTAHTENVVFAVERPAAVEPTKPSMLRLLVLALAVAAHVPQIPVRSVMVRCGDGPEHAARLAAGCAAARQHILRHSKIAVTMEIYTEAPSEATCEALRKLSEQLVA